MLPLIEQDGWTATYIRMKQFNPVLAWWFKSRSTRASLLSLARDAKRRGDKRKFAEKALAQVRASRPQIAKPMSIARMYAEYRKAQAA